MSRSLIGSLAMVSALTMAGCGQSSGENTGATDPAKAAAEMAFQFQPGKYRTTVEFGKVEMPGMPPAMAGQMKSMMSQNTSTEYCVSPEQAARGLDVMKQQMGKGNCKFEKFNASNGEVDSVFTCQTAKGMDLRSASKGSYSATGSKVAVTSDMTIPGGKAMHIEQTVTMERIGDCTPG